MVPLITKPSSMMAFSDGERPGNYGDVRREYEWLAHHGGYLEDHLSEWILAKGPDTASMLQGMLTQDVPSMAIQTSSPAFALDSAGKIITPVWLYRKASDGYFIGCPPHQADGLKAHLERYVIMEDVTFALLPEWTCIAITGPQADDLARHHLSHLREKGFPRKRANQPGYDFILPVDEASQLVGHLDQSNVIAIGWEAMNRVRIEAFEPWFPQDIQPGTNPVIYRMDDAISSSKGCYIGQETVAMTRDRGRPPQVLAVLESPGPADPDDATSFLLEGKTVGESHSQCHRPKVDVTLRIAAIKFRVFAEAATHLVDAAGRQWRITQFNYQAKS